MKNIKEALLFEKADDIKLEIKERSELIKQMVGQFYPSILEDEIIKLNEKLWKLRYANE